MRLDAPNQPPSPANLLQVDGFRRVFAHTAPVFFERGIAKLDTLEISSLSCEEAPGHSIVVSVFDVPYSPEMVQVSCVASTIVVGTISR